MSRNFFYYTQNSYTGGINNSKEPDQLNDDECVLIQNGITDAHGYLDKRSGSALVGNIETAITTKVFTGAGLNDLTTGGTYNKTDITTNYVVEIDLADSTDTFRWSDDGGATWEAEDVAITGFAQTLNNGITITFGATTGHTLGNKWAFSGIQPTNPVTGLFTFITDAGATKELRIHLTKLQYNNSGTWTDIDTGFTTGLDTWFTQANNKVYISNGTDNIHSYDGTTLSDLGNTTYPNGKYTAFWKNYMFVCGNGVLNSTVYKNRVWFSDLGNPDAFTTATSYFDVGKSDGQPITGIASLGEFLVIFKRRSIYILSGSNPEEWILASGVNNLSLIANGIGCVSAKSIVQVGNDLWFMSDDGIRSVRRNENGSIPLMGIVSSNINGFIDDINWTYAHKIAGIYFDNRVYMAIPTGTSLTNDKVLVANTKIQLENTTNPYPWYLYTGWTPYVFNVHLGATPELHWGDSITTNVIQGETTDSDVSGTIDFDIQGKMIDLKVPEMKKTVRFIKYGVMGSGDYDLDFYTSTDGGTWTLRGSINLAQGTEWDAGTWGTSTWTYVGEIKDKIALKIGSPQIQCRFRNNGNAQPVKLYPFTLAIKQRKIK